MPRELTGLGQKPLIMGIVNITPDSFSDGGQFFDKDKAIEHALQLAEEGADIIDIGGESTRPGADKVSVEEELSRVIPVIEAVADKIKIPISIDTYKSEVAAKALDAGASIINDIYALCFDEKIGDIAARRSAYLILMHMRGTPADMASRASYGDVMGEVIAELGEALRRADAAGIPRAPPSSRSMLAS